MYTYMRVCVCVLAYVCRKTVCYNGEITRKITEKQELKKPYTREKYKKVYFNVTLNMNMLIKI